MKALFLYTEIAEYFIASCKEFAKDADVHVIRWPVNKEAPFQFSDSKEITLYTKNNYTFKELKSLIASINPDIIICSGWIDKDYLKLTKSYFKKIPTVLTCDTHWNGSIKQRLACIISRFTLLNIFSHGWVPGAIQKQYLLKLGFKHSTILTGFYTCDLLKFNQIYQTQYPLKTTNFPKRFLYVGRYYEFKGIKELWQAFIELQNEQPNEWELWCLGIGDIEPIKHPKIKHFGFVQPKDLERYTAQTGVFILPSRFEPWGVVVHEFAASGLPLLLSDAVGAKEAFLEEGKNGYCFKSQNVTEIKSSLKKIMLKSDAELLKMGEHSTILAQKISPKTWAKSLIDILEKE